MSAGSPGALGYLAVYAVSAIAVPVPVALINLVAPTGGPLERVLGACVVMVLGTVAAAVYGLPAAVVGCLLVHVALRRVTSQAAHVAAFAAVGALAGWVYDTVLLDSSFGWLALVLGGDTALGRLAVVPMVRRAA